MITENNSTRINFFCQKNILQCYLKLFYVHMKKKEFFVAFLSALVQYYEYHLFGFIAAQIGRNFFPADDSSSMLLKVYAFMCIAVAAKPLGAIVLGKIGDVYGRQRAINIAIAITAFASSVIGLLPNYAQLGVFSLVVLLVMRMCIASCCSAGSDGVRIYFYEMVDKKWQHSAAALGAFASISGSLVASASAWFFTLSSFPQYYWRFSLIVGSLLGIAVLLARFLVYGKQNQEMASEEHYDEYKSMSLPTIVKRNFKLFVSCVILAGGIGASYSFNFIFLTTYYFEVLKLLDQSAMQSYRSMGILLYMVFALIGGLGADLSSSRKIAIPAGVSIIVLCLINCYLLANQKFLISIYLACCALAPMVSMPALRLMTSSVPKVIRYRIFSLCHSVGAVIISAPTAAISIFLYRNTQVVWMPNIYYIIVIVCMLCALNALANQEQQL